MGILRDVALRRHVNRLIRDGQLARHERFLVNAVLNYNPAYNHLTKLVEVRSVAEEDPAPLKERPLLRWLWEHREEILAFILKVAALFMKTADEDLSDPLEEVSDEDLAEIAAGWSLATVLVPILHMSIK